MDSILRITRGIQEALNEVAVGVMDGINLAHNEAMDTVQDAILGEWSMISEHVSTRSHSVGTVVNCLVI